LGCQPVEHLPVVEAAGAVLGAVPSLELVFAEGTGRLHLAAWQGLVAAPDTAGQPDGDQTEADERSGLSVGTGSYAHIVCING
jgi:hypothetical protein